MSDSTAARAIPTRARPTPIAGNGSPSSTSFRRGGRSVNENGAYSASVADNNWRSRGMSVEKDGARRGPERTVGGFEKSEVRAGGGASSLSTSKGKGEKGDKGDKSGASALSHVPCRFYKAGACTAGSACPFSHDVGGKKEICQWFLKGDCKFGHKCALAHVRPGEPMSMDRRNKKEQQREARERGDKFGESLGTSPVASLGSGRPIPSSTPPISHPVPIKSAISASLQSGSVQSPGRFASSPLREPYGPPPAVGSGSPSAGFNQQRISGAPGFGASPSRPSPLSSSFNASRTTGPMSLKGSSVVAHSPLRPPSSSGVFSSSFQHTSTGAGKSSGQLSASFAAGSIWARSETPDEPLSPRRPLVPPPRIIDHAFEEVDDHGEDLIPGSLSDLLTPTERARRMSRHDSRDSGSSGAFPTGAERLAQSASAALPPGGFLQSLWSQDGQDARTKEEGSELELSFPSAPPTAPLRQSLLSAQRSPPAKQGWKTVQPAIDAPYLMRERVADPSSPTSRVLSEHAPGQSLPGGLAAALSRMHMQQPRKTSGLGTSETPVQQQQGKREEHGDEEMFHMDG